jgi:predicted MPP superfamily phosphohydrolase
MAVRHISDLHADLSVGAMRHLVNVVGSLQHDIWVLTGDYRGKTYGPFEKCLEIIDELQAQLKGPVYGVLGNHDSIRMAPFNGSHGNLHAVQRVRTDCS